MMRLQITTFVLIGGIIGFFTDGITIVLAQVNLFLVMIDNSH
ncbi:hypothetical protein ACFSUM_13415 [Virgibacillus siamensis]